MCMGLLAGAATLAQNENDVFRHSYLQPGGTARSAALAGAFGALGADMGCVSLNPAGFGLFLTTEISITAGMEVNDAASMYYGQSASSTRSRFHVGNFGMVLHQPIDKGNNWRSSTFGIVYDRQATFHWDRQAAARDVPSTILTSFVNEANGTPADRLFTDFPFTSGLAWETYAMDILDTAANSYRAGIPAGGPTAQTHLVSSEGRSNTTALFYSANYADRLYIGAQMGILGTRFIRSTEHREEALDPSFDTQELVYHEDLDSRGTGIDLRIGLIGRLSDAFRAGVSYRSPMWFGMTDTYTARMSTQLRTGQGYAYESPLGTFEYNLNTPSSWLFSAAYIAGQHGAVSIDYEYMDYGTGRLKSNSSSLVPYSFEAENAAVRAVGAKSNSVRVGTEWVFGNWLARGGWGYWTNPFVETDSRHGQALKRYTAGIGYRTLHVSIDLCLNYDVRGNNYYPYDPSTVQPVNETLTSYRGLLTLAWRP